MASLTTDQWLGTLLGSKQPPERSMADEELLAGLAPVAPAEAPAPVLAAPVGTAPIAQEPPTPDQQQPAARPSRVDSLLASLQPPTSRDAALAGLFDGLLGGTRYSDDVRGRRNQYEQALIGARQADASAAERAAEAEQARGMQEKQMLLQRRGQDLAEGRAREDRVLRDEISERVVREAMARQEKRDENAMERTLAMKKGGGGGGPAQPKTPEQVAEANEDLAAYLAQQVNVTPEVARGYVANDQAALAGVPKEKLDALWANARNFQKLPPDEQARARKARLVGEGNIPDNTAAARERKITDPNKQFKLVNEWNQWAADIARAERGWNALSDASKRAFAQLAGESKTGLAAAVLKMKLTPEEQAAVSNIQQLANVLIKARSGSAVTGHEWGRTAAEIGFSVSDWDVFNSTAGIENWIARNKQNSLNERELIRSIYDDPWASLKKGGGTNARP